MFTLGNPANSTWVVRKLGLTKSGGPYQFSHIYQRCNNHAAQCADVLNPASEPFCSFTEGCCSDLETGLKCQPECEIGIGEENRLRDDQESAILPDVGLYWHFETDENGEPIGCPGLENELWTEGLTSSAIPNCPKENYAPEGVALSDLVDSYADDQNLWVSTFYEALEKMVMNGYELNENGHLRLK